MAPLSRIIFSSTFLAILTSIVLHSCTKDQILPDDDFKIDTEDHLFGKMKSDFGTHVLLKLDSTLWIWSWNFSGQLGTGNNENSDIPLQVPITEKIVDFDIAAGMVTAIDCIGNIWFWGSDMHSSMMWPEITSPINCSYLNGAKAIGKVFLKGNLDEVSLLILSSRISYELVQKAARARITVILAFSRPTSLAVELASKLNMTLACLARGSGLYIFCGENRFIR